MGKKIEQSSKNYYQKSKEDGIGDQDVALSQEDSQQQESSNQTCLNKIVPSSTFNHLAGLPVAQNCVCESMDSQTRDPDQILSFQIQLENRSSAVQNKKKKITKPRNSNSNNSFKKACRPLRKIVKKYLKVKKNPQEHLYGIKLYFLLSLLHLEHKYGLNSQKFIQLQNLYEKQIMKLMQKESGETKISKEYLLYYDIGIKTFKKYNQNYILEAIKTFYQYETMKQKQYFRKAIQLYEQKRKKLQMNDLGLKSAFQSEIQTCSQIQSFQKKSSHKQENQCNYSSQDSLTNQDKYKTYITLQKENQDSQRISKNVQEENYFNYFSLDSFLDQDDWQKYLNLQNESRDSQRSSKNEKEEQ